MHRDDLHTSHRWCRCVYLQRRRLARGETCTRTTTTAANRNRSSQAERRSTPFVVLIGHPERGSSRTSSYAATLDRYKRRAVHLPRAGRLFDDANCERTFSSTEAACSADNSSLQRRHVHDAHCRQRRTAGVRVGVPRRRHPRCELRLRRSPTPASEEEVGETPTYGYACSSGTLVAISAHRRARTPPQKVRRCSCTTGTLSGDLCQPRAPTRPHFDRLAPCSTGTLSGAVCDVEERVARRHLVAELPIPARNSMAPNFIDPERAQWPNSTNRIPSARLAHQ